MQQKRAGASKTFYILNITKMKRKKGEKSKEAKSPTLCLGYNHKDYN